MAFSVTKKKGKGKAWQEKDAICNTNILTKVQDLCYFRENEYKKTTYSIHESNSLFFLNQLSLQILYENIQFSTSFSAIN